MRPESGATKEVAGLRTPLRMARQILVPLLRALGGAAEKGVEMAR